MLPAQLEELAAASIATCLFLSNVHFWRTTDYFAPVSEENPLLHTWSLAVEEQFYLFFPLLLLVLWRAGRRRVFWTIACASAASLLLSEWGARHYPLANFYLIPARAWELGAGALCALHLTERDAVERERPRTDEVLCLIGLGLVIASVVLYDETTPFPSTYAALPVAGTALLILRCSARGSVVGGLLSSRPLVGVGLISYSTYLWHQPLFAFARLRSAGELSPSQTVLLTLASMALAGVTWRFVEQPFRGRQSLMPSRRQVFGWSLVGTAVLLAAGIAGTVSKGRLELWKKSHPKMAATYDMVTSARAQRGKLFDDGSCRFNGPNLDQRTVERLNACSDRYGPGILVLGDSHAIDLFAGLYATLEVPFLFGLTSGGCRPQEVKSGCDYRSLRELVAMESRLFRSVLFTQSGATLLELSTTGGTGRRIFQRASEDASLDITQYRVDDQAVEKVASYLASLTDQTAVFWIGPRVEPHISNEFIIERGCNHTFRLRPGQLELFVLLDAHIAERLQGTRVEHVSLVANGAFDMAHDFGSCDGFYWSDGDHWTGQGARRFVSRMLERHPVLLRAGQSSLTERPEAPSMRGSSSADR